MRVALTGGRPVRIGQLPVSPRGGSWTSDDMIVAAVRDAGLVRIPAGGGDPETIAKLDEGRGYWYPKVLPGTKPCSLPRILHNPTPET